jgi:diguanylate cyclase (GGDEF)-like protein
VDTREAREIREAFAESGVSAASDMQMFRRFPTLERQFRLEYTNNHATGVLIASAIFLTLIAVATLVNLIGNFRPASADSLRLIIQLRVGLAIPALIVIMLAVGLKTLRPWYQQIAAGAAVMLGVALMTISTIMVDDGQPLYQMSNVLLVCYACLFLGLLGHLTAIVAGGLLAVYVVAGAMFGLPADALRFSAVFIFATSLMTVVSSIRVERLSRKNFLENRFLHEIAERDGLTGLYNRRKFDELLRLAWNQARRNGERIQLLFVDIDCFKRYNDVQGHQAGDECIRQVAQIIETAARRPLDFCARYGGEEFVLVLFGVDQGEQAVVAESIRTAVQREGIPHPASSVADCITVSVGSATVKPTGSRTLSGLIQHADESLYAAKQAGRNLVVHEDVSEFGTTGSFEVPEVAEANKIS